MIHVCAETTGEARVVNHSSAARNGINEKARRPLDAKYFEKSSARALPEHLSGHTFKSRVARYQQTKLCNTVFTLALKVCCSFPCYLPYLCLIKSP